ncbi:MAG: ATP-binding protein [Nocardioidaceae bacterium]
MRANIPDDLAAAIARGGEMGGRLAELDWSSHPLGPPAGWPITTRAIVSIALASRFPTVLWLGEELFLVYNDAYLPVLGDKHPAALGRPGREVWWDIWGVIGPMLSGVMQSGAATWSDDLMLPVISSGRPEERYFTFTYSPIIATDGRVGGVYCVVAETTERVIGERRLQALSALGSALMETGTSAEVVRATLEVCAEHSADLPFLAVYLDDADQDDSPLKGATPGVLEAATSSAAYLSSWGPTGPDLAPSIVGNLGALRPAPGAGLRANRPEQALVIPLADSARAARVGAVVVGLNPLRPFDDTYRAFCRLVADQISAALANATARQAERQRANALAELDRAKTAFLANVSHEFRTPLTLMLGPIEEAIASVGLDTYVAESLATVERNGRRLLRMVNSLLDFSRLEGGETTAHLVVVDVGDLTAQLASSFAEMCRHAGIDLVLDCGSVRGAVDVEMWETVVLNLVSNAFKFTWEGSITVTVEAGDRGGVTVTFADTGSGIAKDDVPRLFDRFYRSADVAGRSVEGTGIGLSLVRSLVELHGGTIEIDSELGAGTNVTVRLPAPGAGIPDGDVPAPDRIRTTNAYVAEAAQWLPAPGPEARGSEPAGGGQPVVLIVDDNADMRRYLARILGGRWRTHVLGDGRSALDWARQNHPDLVVTDVMMPALDGFGLAAALRTDPDLASIPLIMLSARAGPESAGEGMRAGVDDYVVKPFSSAELVRRVSARLEMSARERSGRQHAEQVAERASALAELGAAINSTRTLDELIGSLLVAHSASLAATAVAVAVLEPSGDAVRVRFTGALPSEFTDRYHRVALDAPMPIVEVVRTGVTMVIPDILAMHERYEAVVADALPSVRAAVVEPLRTSDEQLAGALALLWPTPRQISTDDVDQARRVADPRLS